MFKKFHKIQKKAPVSESRFEKTARCMNVKKRMNPTQAFPVNFAKFLSTPILKKFFDWLLLTYLFYEDKPSAPR